MPTDGTLLLEHMPRGKKYLVTALSVCFSVGSVVAAVVGMFTIPGHSCPRPTPTSLPCDVSNENEGWRYLLLVVGLIVSALRSSSDGPRRNVCYRRLYRSFLHGLSFFGYTNPLVILFTLVVRKKPLSIYRRYRDSMDPNSL